MKGIQDLSGLFVTTVCKSTIVLKLKKKYTQLHSVYRQFQTFICDFYALSSLVNQ